MNWSYLHSWERASRWDWKQPQQGYERDRDSSSGVGPGWGIDRGKGSERERPAEAVRGPALSSIQNLTGKVLAYQVDALGDGPAHGHAVDPEHAAHFKDGAGVRRPFGVRQRPFTDPVT